MTDAVPGLFIAAMGALIACAVLGWWFAWRYSRTTFEDTPEGRHVLRFTILLAVTFTVTAVLQLVPVPPFVGVLASLVLFAAIGAELWTRITLLREAQRENDRRD